MEQDWGLQAPKPPLPKGGGPPPKAVVEGFRFRVGLLVESPRHFVALPPLARGAFPCGGTWALLLSAQEIIGRHAEGFRLGVRTGIALDSDLG